MHRTINQDLKKSENVSGLAKDALRSYLPMPRHREDGLERKIMPNSEKGDMLAEHLTATYWG